MPIEEIKLLEMRKAQRISERDYQLILNALRKKSEVSIYSWFINPFRRIAGVSALTSGFLILIILSIAGSIAGVYFNGIFDCLVASNLRHQKVVQPHFLLLFFQNIINWLIISSTFILTTLILNQKKIRVIDYLGTLAFSRYPYLVLVFSLIVLKILAPDLFNFDLADPNYRHQYFEKGK